MQYEGNRLLRHSAAVATKPRELANLFRDVISTKGQGWIRGGLLRVRDLFQHLWKLSESQEEEGQVSLAILKQFELVMTHAHNPSLLIVPSLLPAERPPIFAKYVQQTSSLDGFVRVFEPRCLL